MSARWSSGLAGMGDAVGRYLRGTVERDQVAVIIHGDHTGVVTGAHPGDARVGLLDGARNPAPAHHNPGPRHRRPMGQALPGHTPPPSARPQPPLFLGPFDNLLGHRPRVQRLFGFTHLFEAYKPVGRRIHGYYVCPLLAHGRLIGRADLTQHDAL